MTIAKMKPRIKARWLEALRSGKYVQTNGVLRASVEGGYCCLGVLCDITHPEGWVEPEYSRRWNFAWKGESNDQLPPNSILKEAGLTPIPGEVTYGKKRVPAQRLASMNDDGISFAEIADWIEANL